MSIDDISLPGMLSQLASEIHTLHRMQDWVEANSEFDGVALSVKWGYGQHDAGFEDIRQGVQAIVRERFVEILREAVERKEKQATELHDSVLNRMSRFTKHEEAA